MTKPVDFKIAQTKAARSIAMHLDRPHPQRTREPGVSRPNDKLEAVSYQDVATWSEAAPSGLVGQLRWSAKWSGEQAAGSGAAPGGDYSNDTDKICLKLAEAQAGRAVAEHKVVELTHRLTNVLQVIVTRIERQRRVQEDKALKDELGRLVALVQASADLHRYLLPPRKFLHVDLSAMIGSVAAAIEGVTGMICIVDVTPVTVPAEIATHIAAVVNELAWNAYKHAYCGAEGGVIRILCRPNSDARLRLSVADEGRGLPADFDPRVSEGLGLMVVRDIVRRFGGEVWAESELGARFTLLLSLPRI